jgi:hypothetical protein
VLANEHTGLETPDVFYWGNLVGETGNGISATRFARTMAADGGAILAHGAASVVGVANPFDIDKNNSISAAADRGVILSLGTGWLTRIDLGTVEALVAARQSDAGQAIASALASQAIVGRNVATTSVHFGNALRQPRTPAGVAAIQTAPGLLSSANAGRALKQALAQQSDDTWLDLSNDLANELVDSLRGL